MVPLVRRHHETGGPEARRLRPRAAATGRKSAGVREERAPGGGSAGLRRVAPGPPWPAVPRKKSSRVSGAARAGRRGLQTTQPQEPNEEDTCA